MRLLLHACCGPCLIEPFEALSAEHEVGVVFANPNIHPLGEYRLRRDTLFDYAREQGIRVIETPYDPHAWVRTVAQYTQDPLSRCAACYHLRLDLAVSVAEREGFDGIATTLTVSPHQSADAIRQAGESAVSHRGIEYVHTDFRPRYRAAVERSKALGMYRQRFCGCVLSEIEAEESRARRLEQRA